MINQIESAFKDKDAENVDDCLDELKIIIERYLPMRSWVAVVEAIYDDKLIILGDVQKTLAFRDLFVDVYNQKGTLIEEIVLNDNSSGLFTEVLSRSFEPGLYVTQLQCHDVFVSDFFNVRFIFSLLSN